MTANREDFPLVGHLDAFIQAMRQTMPDLMPEATRLAQDFAKGAESADSEMGAVALAAAMMLLASIYTIEGVPLPKPTIQ